MATALAAMLFDPVMKGFKNEMTAMGNDREKNPLKRVGHGFASFGRGFVGIDDTPTNHTSNRGVPLK